MNKFPTTRSQFNFFYFLHKTIFLLYNWLINFSCRHLTDVKILLTQNLLIIQNPDAENRTCTASQHTHNAQHKKYTITVVTKEAWVPFGFNCWQSSLPSSRGLQRRRFLSQTTPCVPHCENQNHYCHTDYQLHKSCDSQTWYTFFCSNSYRFYTYTPDIPTRLQGCALGKISGSPSGSPSILAGVPGPKRSF